jgi:hypothetical protein
MSRVRDYLGELPALVQRRDRFAVPMRASIYTKPAVSSCYDEYCLVVTSERGKRRTASEVLIPLDVATSRMENETHMMRFIGGIVNAEIIPHQAYWHSRLWC